MKARIKSWFTTILGMIVATMFVALRLMSEVNDLSMWIGICVGVVLVFFKEEWATIIFKKLSGKL